MSTRSLAVGATAAVAVIVATTSAVTVTRIGRIDGTVACSAAPLPRSVLSLRNHTDSPIYAYIDGRFAGRCEPFFVHTFETVSAGEVQLLGRFRCDRWGPQRLRLSPGRITSWTFTEADRVSRGNRPPVGQRSGIRHRPASGYPGRLSG